MALAACSTVPPRQWPPHEERAIVAEYVVASGQPIALPLSRADLTILECAIEPAPQRESFVGDRRLLEPPTGCARVLVRCRYRVYAPPGGPVPAPERLFPGAAIRVLP